MLPPFVGVATNETVPPLHTPEFGVTLMLTAGATTPPGITVTRAVSLKMHPLLLDVAVYVVVLAGVATGFAMAELFKVAEGVQL